jgi:hypothetical protein
MRASGPLASRESPSASRMYNSLVQLVDRRYRVTGLTSVARSGYPAVPVGGWAADSSPSRMAVTSAWARLLAPSFW